ncbi:type IV secretion system protein VirB5 [Pseudomonas sp. BIGb0381]|uniref:P-type DNA transfer protein VirB5 n=1 Tax=Pseudomonas TaxID=286 RepID=UPI002166CCAF|nr:P-type DNA transfer protein VirB5 [Pseudomonas sp. BIGb0381]MCS4315584.1 type IV secretion system protein VirB5 [Pseudomonas sp. BIGb0381]
MKQRLLASALALAIAVTVPCSYGSGIPTVDVASLAQMAMDAQRQAKEALDQLNAAKEAIEQAKAQFDHYKSLVTGNSKLGDFLDNPELNKTLSLDGWEDIYQDARDLGSLRDRYGLVSDDINVQKSFDKLLAVTDALERNYDASTQRVKNAQALRTKLDEVQTPQEKEDLQLRYQQELLELQNQQMRLQQTQMLVAQKERLESKQRAQAFKDHLNGKKS